jgi:hypothetical protein
MMITVTSHVSREIVFVSPNDTSVIYPRAKGISMTAMYDDSEVKEVVLEAWMSDRLRQGGRARKVTSGTSTVKSE